MSCVTPVAITELFSVFNIIPDQVLNDFLQRNNQQAHVQHYTIIIISLASHMFRPSIMVIFRKEFCE